MFQSQPNRHIFSRSNNFCTGGAKIWRFSGSMWQKTSQVKKIFSCARASHSSKKCDKCNASRFLSPEKVINVTSLAQIWDGNLGRNWAKTDPKNQHLDPDLLNFVFYYRGFTTPDFPLRFLILNEFDVFREIAWINPHYVPHKANFFLSWNFLRFVHLKKQSGDWR